jgi:hypothetical protein
MALKKTETKSTVTKSITPTKTRTVRKKTKEEVIPTLDLIPVNPENKVEVTKKVSTEPEVNSTPKVSIKADEVAKKVPEVPQNVNSNQEIKPIISQTQPVVATVNKVEEKLLL